MPSCLQAAPDFASVGICTCLDETGAVWLPDMWARDVELDYDAEDERMVDDWYRDEGRCAVGVDHCVVEGYIAQLERERGNGDGGVEGTGGER